VRKDLQHQGPAMWSTNGGEEIFEDGER